MEEVLEIVWVSTGGESTLLSGFRGMVEISEIVCVIWDAKGGESGLSKSEQYAESSPREGGVLTDWSWDTGEERDGTTLWPFGMLSGRGLWGAFSCGCCPLFSAIGGGG